MLDILASKPTSKLAFVLPHGEPLPAHFHITEVGHVQKNFVDCGGKRHLSEACVLQAWVADDHDHRLIASKLEAIIRRSASVLPHLELAIELEAEAPVLTQLAITGCKPDDTMLVFDTAYKHTACLAQDICLPGLSLPALPAAQRSCCSPTSGCC